MNNKTTSLIASLLKLEECLQKPEIDDIGYFLYERYIDNTNDIKRKLYYSIKPFLPRSIQLMLRKSYIKVQSQIKFPAWPIETIIVDKIYDYLSQVMIQNKTDHVYRIAYWPNKKEFAFVITHDVEWDTGLRHALKIVELEREYGFVSSWNIVPKRYKIDWKIVDKLREHGAEIGVHGLYHDGKLFQTKNIFYERAKLINTYLSDWNAVGFRSESTLRNVEWIKELQIEYDTSFPDTDPYEPQPGGCCSIWPFFIDRIIELPLTLPQDHTLFEIMGMRDISIWKKKVEWIEKHNGLVLINVHPDYMLTKERMELYGEFLKYMKQKQNVWTTLPKEVAKWWRERDKMQLIKNGSNIELIGNSLNTPFVVRTKIENGQIVNTIV